MTILKNQRFLGYAQFSSPFIWNIFITQRTGVISKNIFCVGKQVDSVLSTV